MIEENGISKADPIVNYPSKKSVQSDRSKTYQYVLYQVKTTLSRHCTCEADVGLLGLHLPFRIIHLAYLPAY